jgi:imidazoleglycerol-phosphate dehydratase
LSFHVPLSGIIGAFDTQLAYEFFQGFANHAFVTLHIDNLRGENFTTRPKPCSGVCPRACMALEIDPRGGRDPIDQAPL